MKSLSSEDRKMSAPQRSSGTSSRWIVRMEAICELAWAIIASPIPCLAPSVNGYRLEKHLEVCFEEVSFLDNLDLMWLHNSELSGHISFWPEITIWARCFYLSEILIKTLFYDIDELCAIHNLGCSAFWLEPFLSPKLKVPFLITIKGTLRLFWTLKY